MGGGGGRTSAVDRLWPSTHQRRVVEICPRRTRFCLHSALHNIYLFLILVWRSVLDRKIKTGPEDSSRVEEGLRLSAAMLGYDQLPKIVFIDDGVECLRKGVFKDPTLVDYLEASSDLAGIYVQSDPMKVNNIRPEDLHERIEMESIDLDDLAKMMIECMVVATY